MPVPDTPEWNEVLASFSSTSLQTSSPVLSSIASNVPGPAISRPDDRRKRRRGISPEQRVQRPRLSLEVLSDSQEIKILINKV